MKKRKRNMGEIIAEKLDMLTEEITNNSKHRKTNADFKYRSNVDQYLFNEELIEALKKTRRNLKKKNSGLLDKPIALLHK